MLNAKITSFDGHYHIPNMWNVLNFTNYRTNLSRKYQIDVNPYQYMSFYIDKCLTWDKPIQHISKFNINTSIIYGMLPRMFTAWDHYEEHKNCSGTFLKAICLLPYLKKMNIDVLYLLPVFEHSTSHAKGELGSPYAIKNMYKLDSTLHDDLLGAPTAGILEIEFMAFIEACHHMDIKVILDFTFRTCSRDSDLIIENPNWFYWIKTEYEANFSAPRSDSGTFRGLYRNPKIRSYVQQFADPPNIINPDKWLELVRYHKKTGENILKLINKYFHITTVPGFSDVINDSQPAWTDITFLKMYFDNSRLSRRYLDDETCPPHILQDGVKCSKYPGKIENLELYEYIANACCYYQKKFNIDGARIDMGHALPHTLLNKIVTKAREINKSFIFWSEEFDITMSEQSKLSGFDFINGSMWSTYYKLKLQKLNQASFHTIITARIPVVAAPETADTTRIHCVYRDLKHLKLIMFLNNFIPNTLPFINNGMEIGEVQPMNLGLGSDKYGRYVLPEQDKMYGRLAFFDEYQLHWNDADAEKVFNFVAKSLEIRRKFEHVLADVKNFILPTEYCRYFLLFCYIVPNTNENIFFLANVTDSPKLLTFNAILPHTLLNLGGHIECIHSSPDKNKEKYAFNENILLCEYGIFIGSVIKNKLKMGTAK